MNPWRRVNLERQLALNALREIHRRTGLLLEQNIGRWDFSKEHDCRTFDVLTSNQVIARQALEGEKS